KYRYTGEQFDEETGLYYLRARYYDPGVGRFVTQDNCSGGLGCVNPKRPLSLNKYMYAEGNPMLYVDPSGHFTTVGMMQATAVVGILSMVSVSSFSMHMRRARGLAAAKIQGTKVATYGGLVDLMGGGVVFGGAVMNGTVWTKCQNGRNKTGFVTVGFFGVSVGLPAGTSRYNIKQQDVIPGRNDLHAMSGFASIASVSGTITKGWYMYELRLGDTVSAGLEGSTFDVGEETGFDADITGMFGYSHIWGIVETSCCQEPTTF
ncbi:MAG: RHS repeat-associated core domain-containing protein, partial [Proteobacteria bacterium]|nr:RHS repeat-associated core domain-containing protein [Pseudomonadota bacterium]